MKKTTKPTPRTKLYPHTTDGGAQYLMDAFIQCQNGHKEGICEGAKYIIRLDGQPEIVRAPIPAKKITVHVRGGVAYCDSPAVRIIDHDNR